MGAGAAPTRKSAQDDLHAAEVQATVARARDVDGGRCTGLMQQLEQSGRAHDVAACYLRANACTRGQVMEEIGPVCDL